MCGWLDHRLFTGRPEGPMLGQGVHIWDCYGKAFAYNGTVFEGCVGRASSLFLINMSNHILALII